MDTKGGGTGRDTGTIAGLHKRSEIEGLGYAIPPLTVQTSVGSQRRTHIHPELLQHGKGCRLKRGALRPRVDVNGTNGMYHLGAACSDSQPT